MKNQPVCVTYGTRAFNVTPSDTATFESSTLWIGGAGNVVVICDNGIAATFTGVPAGTILPVMATGVAATGTTATNIVRVQ